MKRLVLLLLLYPSILLAQQKPCTTTFTTTENPVASQCGTNTWKNGGTDGLDWSNVRVTGSLKAFGTQVPAVPAFNDSVAILNGTWGTNQIAQATVIYNGSVGNENEVWLHGTITAHSITGYEFNCSLGYQQIVKWLGPLNSFTILANPTGSAPGCVNGDVLTATATTSGSAVTLTAYINGVQVHQVTDSFSAWTGGAPGIGFWIGSGADNNANAGESDYFASDQLFVAADCNQPSVNTLVNGPTHTATDGDVIIVPAGSCIWTTPVNITKGITIMGRGQPKVLPSVSTSGTSLVTITDNANGPLFRFSGLVLGETARISNFKVIPNGAGANSIASIVEVSGTCTASGCPQFRVDNIDYTTGATWKGVIAGGYHVVNNMFGVVDHTKTFENTTLPTSATTSPLVQINHSAWQGMGNYGDNSFATADSPGTVQGVYLENNSLNGTRGSENDVSTGVIETTGGARYTCRFNTWLEMTGTGICSGHGTAWGGRTRGQRQVEVYYNNVTFTGNCDAVNGLNSGVGYYLSNTIASSVQGCNKAVNLDIVRYDPRPSVWNHCDGTQPWDQPPWSTTSACFDQPTRGVGALMQNLTPVLASAPGTPCTTPGQCWPSPVLDPVYEAGEVLPNAAPGVAVSSDGSQLRILADRDYYAEVSQLAQSSSTVPFDGLHGGTGYGTLLRRPTNCTTGVGYWATDTGTWNLDGTGRQGTLYKCVSSNIWSTLYTPFIYPHPLVSGALSGAVPGNPIVSLSTSLLAFNNLATNTISVPKTVTLTNTGTAVLGITSIALATGTVFTITANTCGSALGIGSNCSVSVTFKPLTVGPLTDTLVFTTNALSSPDNVSLTGTGAFPTSPAVQMSFLGRTGNISGSYMVKP